MTQPHEIAEAVRTGELDPEEALAMVDDLIQADPEEQARQQRKAAEERQMRVQALGNRLYTDAQTQVQLRQQTEERWYRDIRQFNGQYDPGTFTDENAYGSKVFVPLTRRLVNLCKARLFDMLFPSEKRNFIIEPTPVPDLDQAQALSEQLPADHTLNVGGAQVPAGQARASIDAVVQQAKTACDGMQREIDDQLAECRYPSHARDAIHDAVLLGTGVLKGPVPMLRTSKRWQLDPATGSHTLLMEQRPVPVTVRVDLWNFFPDMSSTTIGDCERVWERHYLTRTQAAELRNMPGVDPDALRMLLEKDPQTVAGGYRERLRSLNGANGAPDLRYEVWEYHGPITAQELVDCGCEDEALTDEDPLKQYTGIVWFSKDVVIKAAINPMDTNELPYRVFTWQKDESNIFGFGLPYEVRDQQVAANSSFRAMLDNMGLCVLPISLIDESLIEPVNGSSGIEPGKQYRAKRSGVDLQKALQLLYVESRIAELQQVFGMNKQLIEEVGTLPAFMQGQDAPAAMQSATQASIEWTAANLWVRRCVRDWDDDITEPMITGYYDFNMQHSDKPEIKGDSRVRALGIAALVELEGEAARIQQLTVAAEKMGIPMSRKYALMREYSRSIKMDPDLWLPSQRELTRMAEQEAQNPPPPNPEQEKLRIQEKSIDSNERLGIANLEQRQRSDQQRERSDQNRMELEITKDAAANNITHQEAATRFAAETHKADTELQDNREQRAHDAQSQNAEMALKAQMGTGI